MPSDRASHLTPNKKVKECFCKCSFNAQWLLFIGHSGFWLCCLDHAHRQSLCPPLSCSGSQCIFCLLASHDLQTSHHCSQIPQLHCTWTWPLAHCYLPHHPACPLSCRDWACLCLFVPACLCGPLVGLFGARLTL